MEHYSERSFGFEYEYEGKQYAFHIVSESREEAEGRRAALIHAQFVGELHRANRMAMMTTEELKQLITEWAFARSHTDDCAVSMDERRAAVAQGQEALALIDSLARAIMG